MADAADPDDPDGGVSLWWVVVFLLLSLSAGAGAIVALGGSLVP